MGQSMETKVNHVSDVGSGIGSDAVGQLVMQEHNVAWFSHQLGGRLHGDLEWEIDAQQRGAPTVAEGVILDGDVGAGIHGEVASVLAGDV